jgi:hypothetical protein
MLRRALDRAPPRPVGLDQDHVCQGGQVADPARVHAADPVLGEHPGAGHDRGGPGEGLLGPLAQLSGVFGGDERPYVVRLAQRHLRGRDDENPHCGPLQAVRYGEDRAGFAAGPHEGDHVPAGDA